MSPQVLYVPHKSAYQPMAVPKMVGKVIQFNGEWAFYHEAKIDQWHWKTDTPAPMDTSVLYDLKAQSINKIVVQVKGVARFTTTVQAFLDYNKEHTWGGRTRMYLPKEFWQREDVKSTKTEFVPGPMRVLEVAA